MEPLEISAKTVEEAIELALQELNVSRDNVRVDVISEGKAGILGLGAEEARIRVHLLAPEPGPEQDAAEIAGEVLERLVELLDVDAVVVPQTEPMVDGEEQIPPSVGFSVQGDDLGILIGRHGQTLAALQYIVRLIVNHRMSIWTPIVVDVEGYKRRRAEALQALAARIAEQVRVKGVPFTLEPMPAYERRIIHLALADHPDVITESTGEGDARKVVVRPDRG